MIRFSRLTSLCLVFLGTHSSGQAAAQLTQPLSQATLAPSQVEKSSSSTAICPAQLGGEIDEILQGRHAKIASPQFLRAHWGILIQTLASPQNGGRTLYAVNPQQYFLPASNLKLLTTAAVLHQLGPQFQIRTSVYGGGSPVTTLRVQGWGDPSLTDKQLGVLAQQLKRQGIRQVTQLNTRDLYLPDPTLNPSWEAEDIQAAYGAPVSSLTLNQNAVDLKLHPQAFGQPLRVEWADPEEAKHWRVENTAIAVAATEFSSVKVSRDLGRPVITISGQLPINAEPESVAVAVPDPVRHFLRHFQQALVKQGIAVNHVRFEPISRTGGELELAAVTSPPLSQLLIETNRESNNLYAESLLRILGTMQSSSTSPSITGTSLAAVKTTLTQLGVNPEGYVMADGSGLSRHSLVSPEALVQTLQAMAKSPGAATYRASLPVAGINGTLQNRFRNTPAQGILQAKTGTLSGVSALSGYLNSPNFPPLVFSILVNQSDQPSPVLRQAIDQIVLLLTRLRSC